MSTLLVINEGDVTKKVKKEGNFVDFTCGVCGARWLCHVTDAETRIGNHDEGSERGTLICMYTCITCGVYCQGKRVTAEVYMELFNAVRQNTAENMLGDSRACLGSCGGSCKNVCQICACTLKKAAAKVDDTVNDEALPKSNIVWKWGIVNMCAPDCGGAEFDEYGYIPCCTCGKTLDYWSKHKFCHDCGQSLIWAENANDTALTLFTAYDMEIACIEVDSSKFYDGIAGCLGRINEERTAFFKIDKNNVELSCAGEDSLVFNFGGKVYAFPTLTHMGFNLINYILSGGGFTTED
jgi:hypothetical protein